MKKLLAVLLTVFLCACPPSPGGKPGTIVEIIRTTELSDRYSQQSAIVVVKLDSGRRIEYRINDVNIVNSAGLTVGSQVLCTEPDLDGRDGVLRIVTSREVETEK